MRWTRRFMRSFSIRRCTISYTRRVGPRRRNRSAGTAVSSFPFFSSAGLSAGLHSASWPTALGGPKSDRDHHHLRRLHRSRCVIGDLVASRIYRFLTALGIGGEWAAGAAIVAETWPEEKASEGCGDSPIRLGCRVLFGRDDQSYAERRIWMARVLSRRHPSGVCGTPRSLVGEGTGTLDSCP